jgi:NDP-sugar pyrophosphorylase family protein
MGSRYGGLKQADGMGPAGEAILEYSVRDALGAGFGDVVMIIRKDIEDAFRSAIGERLEAHAPIRYAHQELTTGLGGRPLPEGRTKPWGTAHALLAAAPHIERPFAVVNADDFYGANAYRLLAEFLTTEVAPGRHALVGYPILATLSPNGTVTRGVCAVGPTGDLVGIDERMNVERRDGRIVYLEGGEAVELPVDTVASMNFWGFHPSMLSHLAAAFEEFLGARYDDPKSEMLLPTVVGDMVHAGTDSVKVLRTDGPWFGVTYPDDKPAVQAALQAITQSGQYPSPLWG